LQKKVNNDKYFDKRNTILGKVEMPVAHHELFFSGNAECPPRAFSSEASSPPFLCANSSHHTSWGSPTPGTHFLQLSLFVWLVAGAGLF
jgi:hypothetical protein